MENLFSIDEAAKALAVSHWTLRYWLKTGKLRGAKVGARRVIQQRANCSGWLLTIPAVSKHPMPKRGVASAHRKEKAGRRGERGTRPGLANMGDRNIYRDTIQLSRGVGAPSRTRSHYAAILQLLRERGPQGVLAAELYDNPHLYGRSPRNVFLNCAAMVS